MEEKVQAPIVETPPDEQQQTPSVGVDEAFLNPPDSPDGYQLPEGLDAGTAASVRQWAHDAQLPSTLVAALSDAVMQPDGILEPHKCEEMLFRHWGGEKAER